MAVLILTPGYIFVVILDFCDGLVNQLQTPTCDLLTVCAVVLPGGIVVAVGRVASHRAALPAVAVCGSGPGPPAEKSPPEEPHIVMRRTEEVPHLCCSTEGHQDRILIGS